MARKKPNCADFIVAAVRATRPKVQSLKEGTSAGKGLELLFGIAKQAYSERVFRQSLSRLVKDDVVLLTAQVREIEKKKDTDTCYGPATIQRIFRIPRDAPLDSYGWFFDQKGKSFDPEKKNDMPYYKRFSCLRIYVVADGLPKVVARLAPGSVGTKAQEIIASMQQ